MTLREFWLVLTGHPEKVAEEVYSSEEFSDPLIETLDWFSTDSAKTLMERAERARRLAASAR